MAVMKRLVFPLKANELDDLNVGDQILISGRIFCGRDAVLPKIVKLFQEGKLQEMGINLEGGLIFHTAVSRAGVGPTSSNKAEIESSIPELSRAGIKMHLGKGEISKETIEKLSEYSSSFAIIAPVTALLESKTVSRRCIAFEELGMEAFYECEVEDYPAVIGAIHHESIYDNIERK